MQAVEGDIPSHWWDMEADRCMLIGIFKHGKSLSLLSSFFLAFYRRK